MQLSDRKIFTLKPEHVKINLIILFYRLYLMEHVEMIQEGFKNVRKFHI